MIVLYYFTHICDADAHKYCGYGVMQSVVDEVCIFIAIKTVNTMQ